MSVFATNEDVIFIDGLSIEAVIGVYDWERSITQPVIIDVLMFLDNKGLKDVAVNNDLAQGVNYKSVADDVTEWTQTLKAELVETLAEDLSSRLLSKYPIDKVTIKVSKPIAITSAQAVGVQITRSKS